MRNYIIMTLALSGLPAAASADTREGAAYQELQVQAEHEGTIGIIVTLRGKPAKDALAALRSGVSGREPEADSQRSYTAAQEAFMRRLGDNGVQSVKFLDETPSIALKLDAAAFKRLLAISTVASIVGVPDTPILFDQ